MGSVSFLLEQYIDKRFEFYKFLIFLLGFDLTLIEIKFLLWKFYNKLSLREIAQLEGDVSYTKVGNIIKESLKKISEVLTKRKLCLIL